MHQGGRGIKVTSDKLAMGVNKLRKICIGASLHFVMKITKPLQGFFT